LRWTSGRRAFVVTMTLLVEGARYAVRRTITNRLQMQMLCVIGIAFVTAVASTRIVPFTWGARAPLPAAPEFALLWLVAGGCALGMPLAWCPARKRALTLLAVEVLTMVLFLLGLRWLPKRIERDDPRIERRVWWRRRRDIVIALVVGAGIAALSYALQTREGT